MNPHASEFRPGNYYPNYNSSQGQQEGGTPSQQQSSYPYYYPSQHYYQDPNYSYYRGYSNQEQNSYNQQGQNTYNPQGQNTFNQQGQNTYNPQGQNTFNPQGQNTYNPQIQKPFYSQTNWSQTIPTNTPNTNSGVETSPQPQKAPQPQVPKSAPQEVKPREVAVETKKDNPKPIEKIPNEPAKKIEKTEPAQKNEKTDPPKKVEKTEPLKKVEKSDTKADKETIEEEEEEKDLLIHQRSKDLEDDETIVDDAREHINIVFIGHVDHGKSTICGNILYLTGFVDERTIEKYKKEAKDRNRVGWFLAMTMDLIEEERAKGKTVEVGKAHFATENKRYTILDCPGHENYITNMITGASQADIAVLVVSARKGEFEDGFVLPQNKGVSSQSNRQTREHAILAKTLGVKKLIIAVNKMDEGTVQWNKARYEEIQSKLSSFLKKVGYNIKTDVQFIPISGLVGTNIRDNIDPAICPWYKGPSLLSLLDSLQPLDRLDRSCLNIPVFGKYKDQRGNLIILGKVETGVLKKNDSLYIMPGNTKITPVYFGNDSGRLSIARPGENLSIAVKGVKEDLIHKGFVLCDPNHKLEPVNEFVGQVMIIDLPVHSHVISKGYKAVIHIHTATEDCTIENLLAEVDRKTGNKSKIRFIKDRTLVDIHFSLAQAVCMTTFKDITMLGRFTIRDGAKTIGFGKVLKLGPPTVRTKQNNTNQVNFG